MGSSFHLLLIVAGFLGALGLGMVWMSFFSVRWGPWDAERIESLIKQAREDKVYLALLPVPEPWKPALIGMVGLVIGLGVGGGMGYVQWIAVRESNLLAARGVVTVAQIEDLSAHTSSKGRSSYSMKYLFYPQAGTAGAEAVKVSENISGRYYYSKEVGDVIEVIYVPEEPTIARVRELYHKGEIFVFPSILGGFIALVSLLVAWANALEYGHAVRLKAEGIAGESRIVDLYFEKGRKSKQSYYMAYELPNRVVVCHWIRHDLYKQLKIGDSVSLLYVPDDPRIYRLQD